MQVRPETMDLFKEIHKRIGARSIGRSVAQAIVTLRARVKELEAQLTEASEKLQDTSSKPLVGSNPTSSTPTEAPVEIKPERGEPSKPESSHSPIKEHPCRYYSSVNGIVHCSKDLATKGIVYRVVLRVCDQCWERVQAPLQRPHECTSPTA